MTDRKILSVRRYKAGYEIRKELRDGSPYGSKDFEMKIAYTPSGDYIGNPKWAYRLCKKMGIVPEIADSTHSVCSIGFCDKEQKWYGWSHRAMFGFGIGSMVKKGNCGFRPSNILELYGSLSKEERESVVGADTGGLTIEHISHNTEPVDPNKPEGELKCVNPPIKDYYKIEVGRGEWTAKTLDEAKQMAVDFARSVS